MADQDEAGQAASARALAEAGLHAQAEGRLAEADELLSQAQALDPDIVADVLREHDAGRAPDARLQAQTNRDVETPLPRVAPDPA